MITPACRSRAWCWIVTCVRIPALAHESRRRGHQPALFPVGRHSQNAPADLSHEVSIQELTNFFGDTTWLASRWVRCVSELPGTRSRATGALCGAITL